MKKHLITAATLAFLLGTNHAESQNRTWTNTSSINALWHVPGNWSPSGAPGPMDAGIFLSTATYNVNFDSTSIAMFPEVGTLDFRHGNMRMQSIETTAFDFQIDGLSVIEGANLTIFGLHIDTGTFFIKDTATIDGSHPDGTSVTMANSTLFLDNSSSTVNVIDGAVLAAGAINSGGIGDVAIENGSTLSLDISLSNTDLVVNTGSSFFTDNLNQSNATAVIDGTGTSWTEDGEYNSSIAVVLASNNASVFWDSASLELTNVILTNANLGSGDVIELSNLSTISVSNNANLSAQSFVIPPDCAINLSDGSMTWSEISYDDFLNITFDSTSFMNGGLSFSGTNDLGAFPALQSPTGTLGNVFIINRGLLHRSGDVDTGLENIGNGEVRVESGQFMRFKEAILNCADIILTGGTLESETEFVNESFVAGRGVIASPLTCNFGTMAFSGPTEFLYDFNNGGGVVITSGNSTTTFLDDVENFPGSEIRTSTNSSVVFFGSVAGTGSFTGTGDVFFEGDLRPGNSPGQVSFEGNVFLGHAANSEFEFAGTSTGQFDQLFIDGDLEIAGTLNVAPLNGFLFSPDQEFIIADVAGSAFGQFDGLPEGSIVDNFNGTNVYITYTAGDGNDIALTTTTPNVLLGDVNQDGVVNLLDVQPFVNLVSTGGFQAEADINIDGAVNLLDIQPFVAILSGS